MLKVVFFVIACAVAVNSYVTMETSGERTWMDSGSKKIARQSQWDRQADWNDRNLKTFHEGSSEGENQRQYIHESWTGQGKRQVLDSTSQSDESHDDFQSSENFEIKPVQKVYHDTDPERAGNGRIISNTQGFDRELKGSLSGVDSEDGLYNTINKHRRD